MRLPCGPPTLVLRSGKIVSPATTHVDYLHEEKNVLPVRQLYKILPKQYLLENYMQIHPIHHVVDRQVLLRHVRKDHLERGTKVEERAPRYTDLSSRTE